MTDTTFSPKNHEGRYLERIPELVGLYEAPSAFQPTENWNKQKHHSSNKRKHRFRYFGTSGGNSQDFGSGDLEFSENRTMNMIAKVVQESAIANGLYFSLVYRSIDGLMQLHEKKIALCEHNEGEERDDRTGNWW